MQSTMSVLDGTAGDTNGDGIADIFIRVSYTTDPNLLTTDFIL